jgi:acyl-coenzyme A synthetase/AMP-(fatty) acid ligase
MLACETQRAAMNIVDAILYQCKHHPSVAAICSPGTKLNVISYGKLERFINNIGRQALSTGVVRGSVVAVLVADKIFHAAIVLGLMRIGVITVSARHEKLPKEINVDVAITDAPRQFENVKRVILVDMTWTMGDGKPLADEKVYRSEGDDICRIMLTSGTTGEAKGVAFSHRMLIDRMQHYDVAKGPGFPFYSRVYCDLGLTTAAGFRHLLFMLIKGGTIFFYGEDAISTIQTFDLYKVQAMIVSPFALGEYLKFFEAHGDFTCGFEHISAAGGVMSRTLSERVRARMTPNLVCCYGSTEAGSVACAPAHLIASIPNAVGHVAPWIKVEIVDRSGQPVRPGQEGVVRISGPYNVAGYVGDPGETAKAFRDGWFYPGDIGYLTEDRLLVILGRDDAVLNIGGDKVGPEGIEQVLTSFVGIEQAAAFSVEDEFGNGELWAAVVAPSGLDEVALRAHCGRHVAAMNIPVRFVTVDQLPRNEFGKLERNRLREIVPKMASQ